MDNSRILLAEWHPQYSVLLTWPHHRSDWADMLDAADQQYIELVKAINPYQAVTIICYDSVHQNHIKQLLTPYNFKQFPINYVNIPTNDTWVRDYAPITIATSECLLALDFEFNAWGNKYDFIYDNAVNAQLAQHRCIEYPREAINLILEGGSIDSDGQGTLLTTTACLLNNNRNPNLNQLQLTQQLQKYLGVNLIHWLNHGYLEGDDTDSHVDMLARFIDPHTIAYTTCDDCDDPQYWPLKLLEEELIQLRDTQNEPYKLVALPIPKPIYNLSSQRLPASYANFLIINNAVLIPQYRDAMDQIILARLAPYFPDRKLIPVPARTLIHQHGSIHCATMQIPTMR
ncbi:MAG: agmatine deiminase family protein [Gammaproteobacteria bacterium]